MGTYLGTVVSRLRSSNPSEIPIGDDEVWNCDRWETDDPPVALDELIEIFRRRGLGVGETVMLPAHEPESPNLTGDYIAYREDEHGQSLTYHSTNSDISEYIEYEDAPRSGLLYRLRFWDRRFELPNGEIGDLIDDRPPYRQKPVTAESAMSDEEYETFVADTLQFVRTELLAEHERQLQSCVEQGVEVERTGSGTIESSRLQIGDGMAVCRVDLPLAHSLHRTYERVEDVYDVHEGNTVVLLWETESGDTEYLDGIVTDIHQRSIEIDISFGTRDQQEIDLEGTTQSALRVVAKGIAEHREYEAFETLSRNFESVLRGEYEMEFASPLNLQFNPELELNTYQERAAVDALCADDVFCIHGPPGTGKTRTLVTIIEHAVEQGETVLVCAHSNQAVDNIVAGESDARETDPASLHRIAQRFDTSEELRDLSLIRISGSPHEIDPFIRQHYFVSTDDMETELGETDIVASTTNTAATLENQDEIDFDLVVIDEATQASGPATAVPFGWGRRITQTEEGRFRTRGLRTILAGDHKQLPPFVSDPEMRDRGLHTSLFERLVDIYGFELAQTLYRQYRMHEVIAEFASEEFYDGRLEHGDRNRTATIDNLAPLLGIDAATGEEQHEDSNSYYNSTEAQYVAVQVQKALNHGISPSDIGVITGYSDQRGKIKAMLRREFEDETHDAIDIETIDKFQGGQREVIIVSFTRSNAANDSGFLEHPPETGRKRLNVAITRAKKRLVLIGDWETLATTAAFRDESESCADTFARLSNYLRERDAMVSNR